MSRGGRWSCGILLVAGLGVILHCSSAPDLPDIEEWTGEPQVASKIAEARQAALDQPRSAAAVGRLGMIFQAHELHAEALACYDRALELSPEEPRWSYLAALSMRKSDLEQAIRYFEQAVERGLDHPCVHVHLGDTLLQLGRQEQAAEQYRKALALDSTTTHALYGLAQLAMGQGNTDEALAQLLRAAEIAPWHGEVHTLLAQVYQRLGRPEEARREILRAGASAESTRTADPFYEQVEAEGVNSRAYTLRGQRLAEQGRFAEAEEQFRQVLAIRPGTARDFSNLGGALAGQGKFAEAVHEYRKALETDANEPYALNNLGMALADQGDLAGAVRHLQAALEADPTYAEAHHNLGLVRSREGKQEQAMEHYREALAVNPSFVKAHNDMGTALAGAGRLDEAIVHWKAALEIDVRELSALYNLSVALARQGDHAEAVNWLRRGLSIAPNSSRLVSLLAWELATAPETEQRDGTLAERLARRVYESYPDRPSNGDVMAAALAETGRFEEAIAVAERALSAAQNTGQQGLAVQIRLRLEGYREGRAHRQAQTKASPDQASEGG